MDMNNYMERSTVLVEALPYIQKCYGKTIVIKYGGNAMISEELRSAVISDIILLNLVGVQVVMVHGGGPEIGHMLEKVGKQSRFVDGLRYTDEETMDIVQQVLCGKVNKHLVSIINNLGRQGHRPVRPGRRPCFQAQEAGREVRPGGQDREGGAPGGP